MSRIIERWVLDEPLGSGGMASIYKGHHGTLGHAVAIKVLKRSLFRDHVQRQRFNREAVALASLQHPSVVDVLDFGEWEEDLYMVLELVRGETVERMMERDGALPWVRAAALFDQLLSALALCHESQIVHRDVKPSNVMVTNEDEDGPGGKERLVLIDFGLARVREAGVKLTETGVVHGTAQYMAPEQCRGEDVGPEGDVYSAALVLYEMLSGAHPFRGSDPATLMAQHLFVEPTPLREVAPHVSAGVAAAVHAALAKQASDRPTASAFRAALADAAAGTDPQARAELAVKVRQQAAGIGRAERAIGGAGAGAGASVSASASASSSASASAGAGAGGRALLWMRAVERAAAIRGCLASAGMETLFAGGDDAPPLGVAREGGVVVVVSARDGIERVRAMRASAPHATVVVVDVESPEETTEAIRAGASDMLLRGAPDADLAAKLARLFRRQSR